MKYTVRGTKKHVVGIPRKSDFSNETEVTVGDRKIAVRVLERNPDGTPRLVSIGGRLLPVNVERRSDGFPVRVSLHGVGYPVEIEKVESTRYRPPVAAKQASGMVKAELPGVVTSLFVQLGATVRKGQPLLVLEAMKMENEILSPRDGTVKALPVPAGKSVMRGDLLVEIG